MTASSFFRALRRSVLALALAGAAAAAAAATAHIELDTRHMGGVGWLRLEFNPADATAALAFASVNNMFAFIDPESAEYEGQVGGSAPAGLVFANGAERNSIFHQVQLGGVVSFDLDISGDPAAAQVPTVFALALFGADRVSKLGHQDPASGSLLRLTWRPDNSGGMGGSMAERNFDPDLVHVSAVPEPSAWLTLGAGLGLLGLLGARRRGGVAALPATA